MAMAIAIGEVAPDFRIKGTDGNSYDFPGLAGDSATALIFWCNHCPYVIANQDRVIAMQADYRARGVRFADVCSNNADVYPQDDFDNMRRRAQEKKYNFPYLHDENQEVARTFGAQRTPEVFLFDAAKRLRYHGRIDDNHQDASLAKSHDLRRAIDAVLAGQEPDPSETGVIGCTIKWK